MISRTATFLVAVLAGACMAQSAEPQDAANCASALEKPAYPRIARLANLSGTINTHFTVREDGRADEVQLQGHPILAKEVEGAIGRTRFPEACRTKTVDATFEFRLEGESSDEARASVVFDSKNTYVVTSNATGIICALQTTVETPPNGHRSCSTPSPFSRRIVSNMGIVEFRVPRSAPMKVSRDVDYVVYRIQYGTSAEKLWLTMMFGGFVGGHTPYQLQDSFIKWSASKWSCSGTEGGDWRGTAADGRRWRHVDIPLGGYAAYEGVPQKAADYFDKILGSMCCGKCDGCK